VIFFPLDCATTPLSIQHLLHANDMKIAVRWGRWS
jgi:hypothetical protein